MSGTIEELWMSQLYADDGAFAGILCPTHVVGKEGKSLVQVFMGRNLLDLSNGVGIFVKTEDWHEIDHSKMYIFIHDPCVDISVLRQLIRESYVAKTAEYDHIHITKDDDFEFSQDIKKGFC